MILLHYLLIFALAQISDIFDLKGLFVSNILRKKKKLLSFLLFFTTCFIFFSLLIINFYDKSHLQIINFLFSFIMIFEVCLKISNSKRFIHWIGEGLDKSFRVLIMFIISLNCTYFFTRLTYQIIQN